MRIVLLVALTFATVEIALRVARPLSPALRRLLYDASLPPDFARITTLSELLATTTLGWSPGAERDGFVLGARSLPTADYTDAKAPGTTRMLALGDSFTFDRFPMSRHWTTLVASDLERRTGQPVEVIRFGVPGAGPQLELRLFEIEGARLAPDVVALGFFVGNDFFDELGGGFAHGRADRVARALRTWSLAWRLGANLVRVTAGIEPHGTAATPSPDGSRRAAAADGGHEVAGFADTFDETAPTFTEDAFLDIEAERLSLFRKDAVLAGRLRLERVVDTLELLDAAVRPAGGRLVVMMIPDELQVDGDLFARTVAHAGAHAADHDLEWPQRALGEALAARGIP
ncbi:SGNH/GDSL hydrolase family protein, partial [Candidatus Binatia bacterium]|nr:SGNH/GDSL hydrolase family protein [Candidatus Binatia bacterium]